MEEEPGVRIPTGVTEASPDVSFPRMMELQQTVAEVVLKDPDVTITLTRPAFLAMLLQGKKLPELVQAGMVKVEGNPQSFGAVVANIMNFDPVFNIVTP